MAQVYWKQIRDILPTEGVHLTGSLFITGSFTYNGIDFNTFTGGIFTQTGSFWSTTNNLKVTGSLTIELGDTDEFVVNKEGVTKVRVNNDGILQLVSQSITPSPIEGGFFYSSSNSFYLGFKE